MPSETKRKRVVPPLMPRAERRKLLFAPITFNVIGGHSWGGHLTAVNPDMTQAELRQWLKYHRVPGMPEEDE